MKKTITSLTLILFSILAFSQDKEFETREMTWLGYFNQTRFTDRSGLWVDLHLRLNDDFVKEVHTTIARVAYIYYLNDHSKLMAGYAHQTLYGHDGSPNVPEHRLWQQIQWHEKKSWFNLMQWIRLEERFRRKVEDEELVDDYNFNFRIRYTMGLTIPLKGKKVEPKTPFVFLNNEVFVNFGKNITYNYFDQNRTFAGIGYQFTQHINAHLGYMYVFQQLPEGNKYVQAHAIRFFVFHNLDLRKKNDE